MTESDILNQVINPRCGDLSPESALALLDLGFSAEAITQVNQLAEKNRLSTISDGKRLVFEKYLRVGNIRNLIKAKAHASLGMKKVS